MQRASTPTGAVRIVSWNINRGQNFNGVIDFLSSVAGDVILLQEVDVDARRTNYLNIAREIAHALRMHYVFGCEFQELAQRGPAGPALHGQATLSRFPLLGSRVLRFRNQSGFWGPRWFIPAWSPLERRIGGRMALINYVETREGRLVFYNVHLESRGKDVLRSCQLSEIFDDVRQYGSGSTVVVAGDLNMDCSQGVAASLINSMQFDSKFDDRQLRSTCDSRLRRPQRIDWILAGPGLRKSDGILHTDVRASDHYPLSLTVYGGLGHKHD